MKFKVMNGGGSPKRPKKCVRNMYTVPYVLLFLYLIVNMVEILLFSAIRGYPFTTTITAVFS